MRRRRGYSFSTLPLPKGVPAHIRDREDAQLFFWRMYREANGIRGLYGCPVYLCGSALRDDNADPRDWDFRVSMPDAAFALRFGPVGEWLREGETGNWGRTRWRWSDECVKRSKRASADLRLNVDFQIYPLSYARTFYHHLPRLQLDTRPRLRNSARLIELNARTARPSMTQAVGR